MRLPALFPIADKHVLLLWSVVLGGMLVYWPFCSDYTHIPRFLALSIAMLSAWWLLRKELKTGPGWHLFDLSLLAWYVWSLLSVSWSVSVSEGMFYAQKVGLLLLSYRFFRHLLHRDSGQMLRETGKISLILTLVYGLVVLFQLLGAWLAGHWRNEDLYQHIGGYLGNKSLAAGWLVLLIFLFLLAGAESGLARRSKMIYWVPGLLTGLVLALQVRTALLALLAGMGVYMVARAWRETPVRRLLRQKIFPAVLLLAAILLWKGKGNSLAERFNPLTYLDSDTANERRFVWYKTDVLNADHYWLGVGSGSWKFLLPSKGLEGGYRLTESNVVFTRAHNDYLEVRAENGMVGALVFGGLWVLALALGALAMRQQVNPALAAALGACTAYAVIQYFDFPRERMEFQVLIAFFWAVLMQYLPAKPLFQTSFGWGAVLCAGLALCIGVCRLHGELHLNKMMDAQSEAQWREVAAEARSAANPCYAYTDAAMPIVWHEGVAQYQLGQTDAAVLSFKLAYQLHPWSFQVLHNYASALVKAGRYKESVHLFEQALQINPRYDEGKFNLSYVHARLGDTLLARNWLDKIDTIPHPGSPEDREKNRQTLQKLREFRSVLGE